MDFHAYHRTIAHTPWAWVVAATLLALWIVLAVADLPTGLYDGLWMCWLIGSSWAVVHTDGARSRCIGQGQISGTTVAWCEDREWITGELRRRSNLGVVVTSWGPRIAFPAVSIAIVVELAAGHPSDPSMVRAALGLALMSGLQS